ncbi:MAG: hypothetical protein L0H84_12495 [Pseudonocardia sp.]|nr:hypothetical protein [Pseudonocardia sp.]
MPRRSRFVAVLAVALAAAVGLPAMAAAAPACSTPWTSGRDVSAAQNLAPLVAVRAGHHACFDRAVFQIAGSVGAGWDVGYVDVVRADGSGQALSVPGGARLEVRLHHPAHDKAGMATLPATVGHQIAAVAGFPTLRSLVYGGSFEGYTVLGVGTRAQLPFRVFALPGPGGDTRIVLDVAHRW